MARIAKKSYMMRYVCRGEGRWERWDVLEPAGITQDDLSAEPHQQAGGLLCPLQRAPTNEESWFQKFKVFRVRRLTL